MMRNIAFVSALTLFVLSVALLPHSYHSYVSTNSLVLPNIDVLSPDATSRQVVNEVLPLLPAGDKGDLARSLLEAQASEAAGLHKLWVAQATAAKRMATIQLVAWCLALVASFVLVGWHWRRRHGAA